MSLILKMLSKFDDSGIKKAKHSFSGLKHAIGAIGIGIGVSEVTDLLIDSAKAASADEKSVLLLNTQLGRNAHANKTQIKQSNKFIERMSLQTGIVKNQLRPAYARFANVTHNVKDAQKLLTIAINAHAGSGVSMTKITKALSKAYDGNTKSLMSTFPELKNAKTAVADLGKEYDDMAKLKADPFSKFNNSMEIMKEHLGATILPLITQFIDTISAPGGLIDQVNNFFDDLSNPKTDAGKMFRDIKNAVKGAFKQVKDFFALFGNGDAMKGFSNVAGALVRALPALIALKGIMMLANAGKSIANLVKAMTLITAGNAAGGAGREGFFSKLTTKNKLLGVALMWSIPLIFSTEVFDAYDRAFQDPKARKKLAIAGQSIVAPSKFMPKAVNGIFVDKNGYDSAGNFVGKTVGGGASSSPGLLTGKTKGDTFTTYITVNATNADPKAVVDAVSKYVKTNGGVPSAWGIPKGTVMHYGGH